MNIDKHAYCIMAYNNWDQLQRLLSVLDDKRNDIFLHIDKKTLEDFRKYNLGGGILLRNSKLYYADAVDVRWSHVSLCDAEISLFRSVIRSSQEYNRIHLISGADIPLESQDNIHGFFQNRDEEFIDVSYQSRFIRRLKYYHFFVKNRRHHPSLDFLRRVCLVLQMPFIDRLRNAPLKFVYGSEWCSLTMDAVREIVSKYDTYRYMFEFTTCPDEHYKQMILSANPRFKFAKEGNLRYVDFFSGKPSPKTLTIEDYDAIMQSHCVFARKFDERIDGKVIDKILNAISPPKKSHEDQI